MNSSEIVERLRRGRLKYSLPIGDVYEGPDTLHSIAATHIEELMEALNATTNALEMQTGSLNENLIKRNRELVPAVKPSAALSPSGEK